MFLIKYKMLAVFTCMALVVTACSSTSQTQAEIATSVAQTVQAQNSLTQLANIQTLTPAPMQEITATSDINPTGTTAPVGAPGCTVSARLAGENPADGALLKPGDFFWKTWSLQNTGTCTWDSSYSLVFRSGDLMDGLISYPLPQQIAPDETKNVTIYLKAPTGEGPYTGYWQIQAPWGATFGVGPNSIPFYVNVNVANNPNYGITSVTYEIVRDPLFECPRLVTYTIYATITTNGPYEFTFFWDQSDFNESDFIEAAYDQAEKRTFSREWSIIKGDALSPRWMQIIVTQPKRVEYDKAVFQYDCQPD
jgi:hypothetical protein